jgi:hypothetical protein
LHRHFGEAQLANYLMRAWKKISEKRILPLLVGLGRIREVWELGNVDDEAMAWVLRAFNSTGEPIPDAERVLPQLLRASPAVQNAAMFSVCTTASPTLRQALSNAIDLGRIHPENRRDSRQALDCTDREVERRAKMTPEEKAKMQAERLEERRRYRALSGRE